jgi:hypothetical protein
MLGNSQMGVRINEVRVPAIVFDYPRHSGATDEGITHGSSILAYLVFGPGRASVEGMGRPISTTVSHGPGARPGAQCKNTKEQDLVKLGLELGFFTYRLCT